MFNRQVYMMQRCLKIIPQILIPLAAVLLAAGSLASIGHAEEQHAQVVSVDKVRDEPMTETVPVIARLVAAQSGAVAVEIAGKVNNLPVTIGDRVAKGALLAEVDVLSRRYQLRVLSEQLVQDEADLAAAEAQFTIAENDLNRNAKLKGSTAFNRSRFDTAQQELLKARALIARGRAAIATRKINREIIELEIERSKVFAPYAGVVVEKNTELGSYLRIGDPVVKLVADHSLEIEADIPATRLLGLKAGTDVVASLEDGTKFNATVRAILPVEDPTTRTRAVRFSPQWPDGIARLAVAQSLTLNIPLGVDRQVVTVHKDAILHRSGENVVFIVDNGKAAARNVVLGEAAGTRIEVITGLHSGELAVVRGNERLSSGAAVKLGKGS